MTDTASVPRSIGDRSDYRPSHLREAPALGWRLVMAGGLIAGLVFRIWVLVSPMRVLDSDEAVVGLMAKSAAHGHFTTFFWGQAYGGTLEALLAAPIVRLMPTTVVGLKLVPLVLNAVAAVLIWRIGCWIFDRRSAALAAVLFWMWPSAYIWWATKARGFYEALLVCGLLVILVALRLAARPASKLDWFWFGLAGGVGWWQSPQIIFFAIPAVAWLAVALWRAGNARALRNAWTAVVSTLIGAAPWIAFNIRNPLLSLRSDFAQKQGGYVDHLRVFVREGFAMVTGSRVIYEDRWLGGSAGKVAFAIAVALIAGGLVRALRPRRRAFLVAIATLAFPFLLSIFPNSFYVGEGRYLMFLAPFVALLIAAIASRYTLAAVAVVAAAAVLTASGMVAQRNITSPFAGGKHVPVEVGPVVAALEARDIHAVWADYWISYRIRYQSDDRVAAASTGLVRDAAGQARVSSAARSAWVFVRGAIDLDDFTCALELGHIAFERLEVRNFSVVVPERVVNPGDVSLCLGRK
ncbi:MAG: ArnT family glycosyltransferase [Acidimicrobiia bacterium]